MNNLLLYCRSGFEKECAAEITDNAAQIGVTGFVRLQLQSGYVLFHGQNSGDAALLSAKLPLNSLIFARQMLRTGEALENLPAGDRITPLLAALSKHSILAGELRVEVPDTNQSKQLLKFCRKFTVPLRQALRQSGLLSRQTLISQPVLHVFFTAPGCCYVGYSDPANSSPFYMGIPRLKLLPDAPSRSALKLEEAFHVFIPASQWQQRLANGMQAVDLGACPGGWSYQLIRRNMWVHAIDNGPLAQHLLDSGQVTWLQEDGFKYRPAHKNDWMVCDMAEKPARVAALVALWLSRGWCQETIFNLKLPMKKRYQEVRQNLDFICQHLQDNGITAEIQAKQLYHDREEVTVHVRRL